LYGYVCIVFTADIDNFLRESPIIFWGESKINTHNKATVLEMIKKGFEFHGPDVGLEWLEHLSQWQQIKFGDWCNLVSSIATDYLLVFVRIANQWRLLSRNSDTMISTS
jgi:hypothetical protein